MKYDHIVVEGRTAGCILAAKLFENPARNIPISNSCPTP